MTKAVVRLDCPPVTVWGDHVPVSVTVEGGGAVRDAQLSLVRRSGRYVHRWSPAVMFYVWKATTEEVVVDSTRLVVQDGPPGSGAQHGSTVLRTDGLAPTSAGVAKATVTTLVEAEVAFQDGSVGRVRQRLFVSAGTRYVPGLAPDPPASDRLELDFPGQSGVPHAAFRAPFAATAILRAGASSVPKGQLDVELVRRVVATDPKLPKRIWSGETAFPLGRIETPAVKRQTVASVPFSAVAPGGIAQTTEAPAFSLVWTARATWRAGDDTVTFSVPVVMSAAMGTDQPDGAEKEVDDAPLLGRVLYRMLHGRPAPAE